MATATLAPPRTGSRNLVLRWIAAGLTFIVLAVGAVAGYVYSIARHELPQMDGSIVLNGLSGPVTVIRDKLGVPHIRAASLDDLFYAQGFVTAQDRLWQMDASRRYAAGDLAEIFGPQLLKHDRQQRYLQIREACERAAAALDPQQRHYLEIYAKGVNALIEGTRDHLPLEFRLLRYSPAPWKVEDSLLIGANMNQMLNTQYPLELKREAVVRHLTPQEVADLYPTSSWRDLPPAQQAKSTLEEQTPRKTDSGDEEEEERVPTKTSSVLAWFEP